MEPGVKVRALYDFQPTDAGELPLHPGDTIEIIQKVDDNWAVGKNGNKTGTFPTNFVEVIGHGAGDGGFKGGQKVVAIETFTAGHDGDLGFSKGDVIEVVEKIDTNWLRGKIRGQEGIFPSNYVSIAQNDDKHVQGHILQAKAIQANSGQLDDELSFKVGEIITITEKIDSDWYRGTTAEGRSGQFPSMCVEIIQGNREGAVQNALTTVDLAIDNLGKMGDSSSNVEPWAKSSFPFCADHPGELSFMDGERIKLRKRIDDHWLEGEVDGKVGIFPSNYVKIMVDIPAGFVPAKVAGNSATSKPHSLGIPESSSNNNSIKSAGNQWKNKKAKVLYEFKAETTQDLGVKQGEIITIVEKVDDDWIEAKHPNGKVGFVPANYVKLIEKPVSPSVKRKAPAPPQASKGKAPSAPGSNALDIFDMDKKNKAPSVPKTNGSTVDDLFSLDPLGKDDVILQPQSNTSVPKDPALPSAFKPGGGAFRPVSFQSKPEEQPPFSQLQVTDGPNLLGSFRDLSSLADTAPVIDPMKSILDITPIDDAPIDDILAPVLSPPPGAIAPSLPEVNKLDKAPLNKTDSVDSNSKYNELATAQPFNASATKQVRSVSSPVKSRGSTPSSPPKPEADTKVGETVNGAPVAEDVSAKDKAEMEAMMLTMDQVSQDLDNALSGEEVKPLQEASSTAKPNPFKSTEPAENTSTAADTFADTFADEFRPPVPQRQPSPNPFAAAVEPIAMRGASESSDEALRAQPPAPAPSPANPFSLESTPDSAPSSAEGVVSFFSQSKSSASTVAPAVPAPPVAPTVPTSVPARFLRDDSVASEWSDDMPMQNITFNINPPSQFTIPTAVKLPPPPSPRRRDSDLDTAKPKVEKFDPKSIRPRPRAGSLSSNEGDSPFFSETPEGVLSDDEIKKIAPDSDQFRKDLAVFQASVQDMFDTSAWDTSVGDEVFGTPTGDDDPGQPSLLDADFDSTFQIQGNDKASLVDNTSPAAIGDLLGIGGAPEAPPTEAKPVAKAPRPARPKPPSKDKVKKSGPPRPAPPKAMVHKVDDVLSSLRPEGDAEANTQATIRSLEASIAEFHTEIEKQEQQRHKLDNLLHAASPEDRVDIEQQLTECQGNIQQLQGELHSLQEQLNIVRPDPVQAQKAKNIEFRNKVITELIDTETDYVRDIKLCKEGFMTVLQDKQDEISEILVRQVLEENEETGGDKPARGLELEILFGNIEQVIEVAEAFLQDLKHTTDDRAVEDQFVGACMMRHCQQLQEAYAQYCRNHDDATSLLEKYEENLEVQEYINQGLELVRQSTNCWDLASFLIKPVQRILKYHLLLAELEKYTEEDHEDKETLQKAITTMTEVATAINEFKRRKDLVMKYRHKGQEAISEKIGRLNLHSIRKKTQRVSQRLNQVTGIATQTVDLDFDGVERRFINLEKTIKIFVKDVNAYLEQLKEATASVATVGNDISDYYASQSNLQEVNKYEAVQRHLANKLYKDYTLFVQQRVISPLSGLIIMFQGPHKLIQKRFDKLLDYDSFVNKVEKTKDKDLKKQSKQKISEKEKDLDLSDDESPSILGGHKRLKEKFHHKEHKEVKDDKESARKNYEALNIQLKDELPKLCDMAVSLFYSCVVSFVEAERDHINSTLKRLYPLLELSIVTSSSTVEVMENFETSHHDACTHMLRFGFVPKSFNQKSGKGSWKSYVQPSAPASKPNLKDKTKAKASAGQTDKQKTSVMSRYPTSRMYQVTVDFKAPGPMDISARKGDVVGVIKEQDPSGGNEKWYVDNGDTQGFLPTNILVQYGNGQVQSVAQQEEYGSDEDAMGIYAQQQQAQYYYAEWAFEATGPSEISLAENTVVMLVNAHDIEGNPEWWLVDKDGRQGYVPSNYLARIES